MALLTRLPVGGFPYDAEERRWANAHLPLVGTLVGAVAAAAWAACLGAGDAVASIVAVGTSMVVTGALHEDCLADTADALGGGASRDHVFHILKDPRVGTYGVCALAVSILLRCAALARLGSLAPVALVFVGAGSRLAPVALMVALPYVTPPELAKNAGTVAAGRRELAVASGTVVAVAVLAQLLGRLTAVDVLCAAVLAAGAVASCGAIFRARVGGITGDFLGAAEQASECAMLLGIALARGTSAAYGGSPL
jgi:adenosylcobinamide-GDP ribazoletransferase